LSDDKRTLKRLRDEFLKFQRTVEELRLLKQVARDLRNLREMIKLKKYD